MKLTITALAVVLLAMACTFRAEAQYYNNGQDPASTRWNQHKNDRYRLIYPRANPFDAQQVALVLDTAYHALHYGFTRRASRLPVILRTHNLRSNGVVTWTPRRAELLTSPPGETYAMPWLKQLAVHEYRHVVQMSNLNRHTIKAASFLLGEQAVGASAIFVPKWFFEGDAVLAETGSAAYGRALQPEFTLAYRAYLADGDVLQFSTDKWFCGSYRDHIPNHYQYGYQMVNAGFRRYGPDMWETLFDYTSRHPYLLFPRSIALKKHYGTSTGKLFRETFRELQAMWNELPPTEENMRIVQTPTDGYTVYSYPVAAYGTRIVAHKHDFVRPDRFVLIDPQTGEERLLAYTGIVSSRPVVTGDALWWTEYQSSRFWEQKNRSVVRRMLLDRSYSPRTVPHDGNLFYVTPYSDKHWAAVSYDPIEKYAIVLFDPDFKPVKSLPLPIGQTVHGMAWDEKTHTLALITLGETGMALTGVTPGLEGFYPITRSSFVTINHLTAGNGRLHFNSIQSGKDEAHGYDLAEQKEFRITASQFGSVMPSVEPESGRVWQVTYRRGGYMLSVVEPEAIDGTEVVYSRLPINRVNPELYDWGLPNLDEIDISGVAETRELSAKRYRKGTHLFRFHSWSPVGLDAFETASDHNLDFNTGLTLISQNDLSNTEAFASYGHVNGHHWWRGAIRLLAWAPKFEIRTEYDGGFRGIIRPNDPALPPVPEGWADKKYFSVQGRTYLPINLSSGHMARSLTPSVSLTHYNTALYLPGSQDFAAGYEKAEVSLAYAQNVRMAYRDLAPRWGFGVQASWATAPFHSDFASLWSLYANVYLPGAMPNHSLRLRGAVQAQKEKTYHFGSNILFPRGIGYYFAPEQLGSALADYRFPVAYPDCGIDQFIYIKRISANLFGGYARYKPISVAPEWRKAYSYGGEISVDFSPFRMAGADFTFLAALYKTNIQKSLNASLGIAINW